MTTAETAHPGPSAGNGPPALMMAGHNAKQEVFTMAATQRPIPGTFSKVPGGYEQKIGENMSLFVPDMCAASFDETTGQLQGYAPDY